MNPNARRAIGAIIALVVAYIGYEVYVAGDSEIAPPNRSNSIVLENGHGFGRRIGSRSWSVDYERVVANGDQTVLDVYGVKRGVVFRAGKPYLHVAADHATINTVSHDFTITGHVHVETIGERPGKMFNTSDAQWTDAAQTVTMPKKIAIYFGSQPPLIVGSLKYDVKTGDIDVTDIAGPAQMQ